MINVTQSSEGSVSGQDHTLTCIATVVNGVLPSLVMVNWDREDTATTVSDDTMYVSDGLQFTRIITFSPILTTNGGQHTCSVSVTSFSEADNSADLTVVVNGKKISCMYIAGIVRRQKLQRTVTRVEYQHKNTVHE